MRFLGLLLTTVALWGQPVFTSDTTPPVVQQSATHQFTASPCTGGCTFSLRAGSAGSITTGGLYTAPASITRTQSIYGCQLLAPDAIWNADLSTAPVNANNATWLGYVGPRGSSLYFGPGNNPVNVISSGTPTQNFTFTYMPTKNGAYQVPNLTDPGGLKVQFGYFMRAGDRHFITVRPDTCQVTEIYNSNGIAPPYVLTKSAGAAQYNSMVAAQPAGATNAAGTYFLPGMVKAAEIMKALSTGDTVLWHHAINITLYNYSQLCAAASVYWPATSYALTCSPAHIPYGAMVRLKASYTYGGSNPVTALLVNTLKHYPMVVTDGGTPFDHYGMTDGLIPQQVQQAFQEITTILNNSTYASTLEFIDPSGLAPTNQAGVDGILIDPVNAAGVSGFTMPQFADVIVTDGNSATAHMRVQLQAPTFDFEESGYVVQAGSGAFAIPYHLTGIGAGITCSTSPGTAGSVDNTAAFTPSATLSARATETVTCASTTDATVKSEVTVLVLPNGSLYATVAGPSDFTDSLSNVWMTLNYVGTTPGIQENDQYGVTTYQDQTGFTDWQTASYSHHPRSDVILKVKVTPGDYLVKFRLYGGPAVTRYPFTLSVNGTVGYLGGYFNVFPTGILDLPQAVTVGSDGWLVASANHTDWGLTPGSDLGVRLYGLSVTPLTCPGAAAISLPRTLYPLSGIGGTVSTGISTYDPCAALTTPPMLTTYKQGIFPQGGIVQ